MSSGGTTDGPAAGHRAAGHSEIAKAVEFVNEADELIFAILKPGRWPEARTVERFLQGDRLERVLSLYGRAIRLDPEESAYPWNLASALNRLGLNDLALGFMARAIHVADRTSDEDWSGPDAYVALAEIAIDAGDHDVALTALARARKLGAVADDAHVQRLLNAVRELSGDPRPELSLAGLLERLPAA